MSQFSHSATVCSPAAFLKRAMLELASPEARLSLEGDLSSCKFPTEWVLANDEQDRLHRSTIFPRQEFVVLRLLPESVDGILDEIIAAGLDRKIIHIQIDSCGALQLGAYDFFQHALMGPLLAGHLAKWKADGLISAYEGDSDGEQGLTHSDRSQVQQSPSRMLAIFLVLMAAGIAYSIISQMQSDDGGPPIGTICMALPAVFLLIAAGVLWSLEK